MRLALLVGCVGLGIGQAAARTAMGWDENGYLMYCPCQGQLANQIDYLMGAIYFARALDRTLVVPPFITYNWDNNEWERLEVKQS